MHSSPSNVPRIAVEGYLAHAIRTELPYAAAFLLSTDPIHEDGIECTVVDPVLAEELLGLVASSPLLRIEGHLTAEGDGRIVLRGTAADVLAEGSAPAFTAQTGLPDRPFQPDTEGLHRSAPYRWN